ncbi:MAG: thiamine phosphate synthase [Bacteroidales bacterium]|nr:thiamine phosphate synthase [Bacteroidales bacterium]
MLQFISKGDNKTLVVEQVKEALAGGCQWIELRMEGASDEDIRQAISEIKPMCQEADAFLIISGRVDLCKELELGGVHLKKSDMLPSKARLELGAGPVIGVDANTVEDITSVRSLDIDYISLSPFRKENDDNALGIEGVKKLAEEMDRLEMETPRVAAGNILTDDVDAIMNTGVNGIAVSKAIADSRNIVDETRKFIKLLEPYDKSGV